MDRDFSVLLNDRSSGRAKRLSLLAASLLALNGSAVALGVGRPVTQSALGQPLNLLFPVRLSADETLTPDCVRADVVAGDAKVPSGLVQLLLEGESDAGVRGVRLQSSVQIDEPIVTVSLSLGCPTRFTRQYTAFIDPPGARMAAPSVTTLPAAVLDSPPVPLVQVTPATLAVADVVAPRNYSPALRAALATSDAKPAALLAPANAAPSTASETSRAPAPAGAKPSKPKPEPKQGPVASAKASKNTGSIPEPKKTNPRLRLDAPERVESASLVASAAAPSAAASQVELLFTLAQLEALGQSLTKVQQEQRATEARLLAMRAELAQAQALQAKSEGGLVWLQAVLAATVLGLAGGCVHLWRSRRRERRLRDQQWWASGQAVDADPAAAALQPPAPEAPRRRVKPKTVQGPTPGLGPLGRPASSGFIRSPDTDHLVNGTAPTAVIDTSPAPFGLQDEKRPVSADSRFTDSGFATNADLPTLPILPILPVSLTVAVPAHFAVGEVPDRQVTVEELIDLEQQVDFFVVLGQDDAAIDLLQARINTGQANALPYLKLLELHQNRGDVGTFADLAEQFGARFGALPPTWGTNLNQGRGLESYDIAMHGLLSCWENTADSMVLLQNLLARGSGNGSEGGEGDRGFDLPAYRDLLMLYSVARDRAEQDMRSDEIDLFLPLDEAGDEGAAMLATMVWQVQPALAAHDSNELDISLDDEPITRP